MTLRSLTTVLLLWRFLKEFTCLHMGLLEGQRQSPTHSCHTGFQQRFSLQQHWVREPQVCWLSLWALTLKPCSRVYVLETALHLLGSFEEQKEQGYHDLESRRYLSGHVPAYLGPKYFCCF